jgi:hypothetical protein
MTPINIIDLELHIFFIILRAWQFKIISQGLQINPMRVKSKKKGFKCDLGDPMREDPPLIPIFDI